jgi:hypothetical protein
VQARTAFTAAVAALVLALAACGGDDENVADTPARPELTVPGGGKAPTLDEKPRTTKTGTSTTTAPAPSGGTPAPTPQQQQQQPQGQANQPQDSPQNDTPPPKGSPAQKFEQFCEDNPGAC